MTQYEQTSIRLTALQLAVDTVLATNKVASNPPTEIVPVSSPTPEEVTKDVLKTAKKFLKFISDSPVADQAAPHGVEGKE